MSPSVVEVFISYAYEDEALLNKLAKHLKSLKHQGYINDWYERRIAAVEEWKSDIDSHIESADIILLLISADFLTSDYCYDVEIKRSLERHNLGEVRVIPIILRSVDWHCSPFGKLSALPTDGKAITSWQNEDEAFTDVVRGLRKVINSLSESRSDYRKDIPPETLATGKAQLNQTNRDNSTGFQISVSGGTVNITNPNLESTDREQPHTNATEPVNDSLNSNIVVISCLFVVGIASMSAIIFYSLKNSAPNPSPVYVKVYSEPQTKTLEQPNSEPERKISDTKRLENIESEKVGFVIPAGYNIKEMAQYFEDNKHYFTTTEFINATVKIPRDKFPWLPEGIDDLEGFLFPGTYKIQRKGITAEIVINRMLKQFEDNALPLYKVNKKFNPKLSLLQLVSLSSIVEKETVFPSEHRQIAGIFINRLNTNMRLESDSTVEYGLRVKQTIDRPLTFVQVMRPNPYNTYKNAGIPPGPISSPGISSLKAVLAPDSTDFLFFAANYDGTHIFSRTLREHVEATNSIRQRRNSRQ
jgi:uncharacterized YceG family protein